MSGLKPINNAPRLVHYDDTGNFLVIGGGKMLRYDERYLYFWDARAKCEVPVARPEFDTLLNQPIQMTAYGR